MVAPRTSHASEATAIGRNARPPDDVGTNLLGATIGIHQQWRLAPDQVDLHRAYQSLRTLTLSALARRD